MAEIKLTRRVKYAGDIVNGLIDAGWDFERVILFVNNLPDAKLERPKGRWIYHECVSSHDGAISGYSCSQCHGFVNEETFDMDEFHKDFCGNCGADMRGESK